MIYTTYKLARGLSTSVITLSQLQYHWSATGWSQLSAV